MGLGFPPRKAKIKYRASVSGIIESKLAAMNFNERFGDVQTEAGAGIRSRARRIRLGKTLKNTIAESLRNSRAVIGDRCSHAIGQKFSFDN